MLRACELTAADADAFYSAAAAPSSAVQSNHRGFQSCRPRPTHVRPAVLPGRQARKQVLRVAPDTVLEFQRELQINGLQV
jgi:hypothetical protein